MLEMDISLSGRQAAVTVDDYAQDIREFCIMAEEYGVEIDPAIRKRVKM